MKNKKYRIIFAGYLIWILAGMFVEKDWVNIILVIVTLSFLLIIIYDLMKNNLIFERPSLLNLIIDILVLSTILSGSIVSIDYANYFIYIFIICTLVFIFTKQREQKM